MTADGLLRLPPDVVLVPVATLPADTLRQVEHNPGDFALTRPQSRTPSRIVSGDTARLLEEFREPVSLVDAVIRFSASQARDPRQTLEAAFPVLKPLIDAGLLLAPDSLLARPIDLAWRRGDVVGGLTILEPVDVVLDTEVYLARAPAGFAALKIARPGAETRLAASFGHEAAHLSRLDGTCSPRLLAVGEVEGCPFLATSWCRGVDAFVAAALARRGGPGRRAELAAILAAIAEAYARLHGQGIVHGDVHPRNVFLGGDGRATLIDFGSARDLRDDASPARGRGVVVLYMEPELARARRDGSPQPPADERGEQYAVGALLYSLATGAHTHDFVLEEQEMLRQLVEDPPLPFHARGAPDLPHTERVILRTLAKAPAERFPSLSAMRDALLAALAADTQDKPAASRAEDLSGRRLRDEVVERSGVSGPLLATGLDAPTASVNTGAAGLAYALLRIAQQEEDERLLAAADVWANAAVRDLATAPDRALHGADLELTPDVVGPASLYHAAPGVHAVAALVAHARADAEQRRRAVEAFTACARQAEPRLELAFGMAGTLLGCAILTDALRQSSAEDAALLQALGEDLSARILRELDALPPIGEAAAPPSLGMAHGWGGILYALLTWARATGGPPPKLEARLDQLAALATPCGRGLAWPITVGGHRGADGLRASWCNGAAGLVYLWTLAHDQFGDPAYAELATAAGWTAYEGPATGGDLCCGLAGRAYALLHLYRRGAGELWRERAQDLAGRAAEDIRVHALRRDSLYKGEIGVALLAVDLERPEEARMPFFEIEEWPTG
jgi:serine/threonine-protein kinase